MLIADFNYLECLDGKKCGIEGQWPTQSPRCQRDCHGEKGQEEGVELHYLNILVGIFLNISMIWKYTKKYMLHASWPFAVIQLILLYMFCMLLFLRNMSRGRIKRPRIPDNSSTCRQKSCRVKKIKGEKQNWISQLGSTAVSKVIYWPRSKWII